ncbi:tyrosine-protein kinase Etk/Wzc [Pseudomonas duriflava]|uniref:Tyrosine-protein kinase Etk/Wzc n=1 Tax=Pseudomonas duriflava TaxID=459528 RepID=A0A562PT69_9PSED|nr:polysaccharide biosynthesis tyrosine autokinase [Pseudomonas duriflava]TWI47276.1 tyrosine-protein kinase Etk/Wzc [Pseudomonas duriflava]
MTAMSRTSFEPKEDNAIDLMGIAHLLLDHKWLIGSITVLFAALGLAFAILSTPAYIATAMIQIEPKKSALTAMTEMISKSPIASQAVTEIELIKSRAVLDKVVENLKLNIETQPKYFPLFGHYLYRTFEPTNPDELAEPLIGLNRYAWGGERLNIFQFDVPDDYLGEKLRLIAGENGAFTLMDPDNRYLLSGQVGQPIAQNGFKVQVAEIHARPGTEFKVTRNRVLTTALAYQNHLKASEAGKESGIIYLSLADEDPLKAKHVLNEISQLYVRQNVERSSAEAAQRLEFLQAQLPTVKKSLEQAEVALNEFQTHVQSADISIETKNVLDKIVGLETRLSELKLKQTEYDRLFTKDHPSYRTLMGQMAQLDQEKKSLQKKVESLPSTQQELLRLNRDLRVTTQTYTFLLNQAQEQDIIRAGTIGNVRLIDLADANVDEPATMRTLIVLLATILGAFLAIGLVFIRQAFNRGVESADTIEQLGLPVYAAIPFSKDQERLDRRTRRRNRPADKKLCLLAVSDSTNLSVEAIRSLRSSLHFAMLEAKNNLLMISSPTPGVGKSFVSSNLAAVVAQTGQNVLLIDADMRKGYLHKLFGLEPKYGLSEVLTARIDTTEAIYRTGVKNLDLLPCGQVAPNPSELLTHLNFTRLLTELGRRYDLVIIDTPPILAVTDASLVGRLAGTTLLVARFAQSTPKAIENARRRFLQNGIAVKGVIFNAVQRKASVSSEDDGIYAYYEYRS